MFKTQALDRIADAFLNSNAVYIEQPNVPMHERWGNVLCYIPEMRPPRKIHSDLTPLYQAAYDSWDGNKLYAAWELCHIQARFFEMLNANYSVKEHTITALFTNCVYWMRKLSDRIDTHTFPVIEGRKYVPGSFDECKHGWLH